MEERFTPGPWKVISAVGEHQNLYVQADTQKGGRIARLWNDRTGRDANAHLIATAPELYAALKGCHAAIDMLFARLIEAKVLVKISDTPEFAALIDANKALAKARGES